MNSKRQTVWLVSMLGLMVVLSAYYLLTDEAEKIPGVDTADSQAGSGNEIVVEGVGLLDPDAVRGLSGAAPEETEDEAPLGGGPIAGDGTGGTGAAGDKPTGTALTDKEVLERLAATSGADLLTAMQIERDAAFSRRFEELTAAIADESASEEAIAEAVNKHNALMDLEAKLIAFEEKLLADYANAAVIYDDEKNHYTVHISAPELQRSEAVSIIMEAVNDLEASVHQVSVKLHR